MDQINLYSKYHAQQRADAAYVLNKYFRLIKWDLAVENVVADVGCGDGEVTSEILLPFLPPQCRVVGFDVSNTMIEHATKKHSKAGVQFVNANIAGEVPPKFENHFDHAFSFYCLHWIENQRQALENLIFMLKKGGEVLLVFLSKHPIFEVYENMSNNPKWRNYLQGVQKYISPYQHSQNPEKDFGKLLQDVGLTKSVCKVQKRGFVYENFLTLRNSLMAVNPFVSKIPEGELENYMQDLCEESKRVPGVKFVTDQNQNAERIHVCYDLFVVLATKN